MKMTKESIIAIYEQINKYVQYAQFNKCNAFVGTHAQEIVDTTDGTVHEIQPVKSYDTVVGFYDITEDCFCEIGKFSPTTSKQCYRLCHELFGAADRVNAMHINWY